MVLACAVPLARLVQNCVGIDPSRIGGNLLARHHIAKDNAVVRRRGAQQQAGFAARLQPSPAQYDAATQGALPGDLGEPSRGADEARGRHFGAASHAVAPRLGDARRSLGVELALQDGALHAVQHLAVGERFFKIVGGPQLDGLHRDLERAVSRHHDHGRLRRLRAQPPQGFHAILLGQPQFEQHHVGL